MELVKCYEKEAMNRIYTDLLILVKLNLKYFSDVAYAIS